MDEAARLGVDPGDLEEVRSHFTSAAYRGLEYEYLGSPVRGIERGTVRMADTLVRGYPTTPRVLMTDPGVPMFFDGPLAIEEKLNGYNVRIAHVGEPLAFTRGGHICPYTTHVAREELNLEAFFGTHPEQMLCTEFIGPENPYTAHHVYDVASIEPRVFDVRHRETGRPMPVERRRSVIDRFGFPQPEFYGVFEPEPAVDAVREVIQELDASGREGVVMQSVDGRDQLKYTTGSTHRSDLEMAFSLPFDYGQDFLFSRLIREAFQAVEFEEDKTTVRERAHRIGESILKPMVETIRAVDAGETVGEFHTVRGSPSAITELLSHFEEQGLELEIERDDQEGDQRVVALRKVSNQTRDKVEHFLNGGTIDQ
ncbi:RNA ligase [Halodesulfurarchaeum sp.]|uniref:RNA ligase n=1 Tax=Halodesulfurarchaeum sp. TaxID=1980530 RepID=UPI002FC289D7